MGMEKDKKKKIRIRILDENIELKKFKRRKISVCRMLRCRKNRSNKSSVLSIMKKKNGLSYYNIYDSNWRVMMEVRL